MYGHEKRKGHRKAILIMDAVHIIIGILVVALAVIIFLNPEGNQILLPAVFALAAGLNIFNGIHNLRISGRTVSKKVSASLQLLLAAFLAAVAVISAISFWR